MSGLSPEGEKTVAAISDGKGCAAKTILDSIPLEERKMVMSSVRDEYANKSNSSSLPLLIFAENTGAGSPDEVEVGVSRLRRHAAQPILYEKIDLKTRTTSDNFCLDL